MADYTANIAAFIQVADGIIRVCRHFIHATKDAPRDMVIISGEVTSLRAILLCLGDMHLNPKTASALPSLFAPDGPVSACYKSVSELERLLPRLSSAELAGKGAFSMKQLSWALKDSQVRKLLADINLHKSTLLLALTGDLMYEHEILKAYAEERKRHSESTLGPTSKTSKLGLSESNRHCRRVTGTRRCGG